ncbi:MAG: DUF5698 domain-containing protein [Polyangia bacterium]|jgi:uncharacterized protein YebE (UPF0316 family)|nr:DUF5698 domain-containing protein [Polyangia bacterium]
MEFIAGLPVWLLALLIFCFRVVDVSLGTVRTLSVVQGRITLSVVLGFFEVLIWITAVSQVIAGIRESALLLIAYAGGFAAGNAVGILIESRIGLGSVVVRLISTKAGHDIADALRGNGWRLTTFLGEGRNGPVTLIYLTCPRRVLPSVIERARAIDPQVFWAVESLREQSQGAPAMATPHSTGWRAVLKRK